MIHGEGNKFTVGSTWPSEIVNRADQPGALRSYIEREGWDLGSGVLIHGGPASDPSGMVLNVFGLIGVVTPVDYWTVPDFLADLKRLWFYEDQVRSMTRDDALWQEYLEWERNVLSLRESPLLILDRLHMAYTPMHYFELEALLVQRRGLDLPTIVASDSAGLAKLPATLRAEASRGLVVGLGA